jgi:uncharacterized protein Veg
MKRGMTKMTKLKRSIHANTGEILWLKICNECRKAIKTITEWFMMPDVP